MFHLDESISASSAGCPLDQSRENINAYRHSFLTPDTPQQVHRKTRPEAFESCIDDVRHDRITSLIRSLSGRSYAIA
jgi:hypothetical protein